MNRHIIHSKHKEMNNLQKFQQATFASYWASLHKTERILTEKQAETDRQMQETDRRMQETDRIIQETGLQMKEASRLFEKSDAKFEKSEENFNLRMEKSEEKFDRQMKRSKENWERRRKKSIEDRKREMKEEKEDWMQRMKKLEQMIGGIGNNNGEMAEEFFFNTIKRDKTLVNEKFDRILRNRCIKNGKWDTEFDILLFNGNSTAIIEVKYRATADNINIEKLTSRIEPLKVLFPECQNHHIYLGVAALSFQKNLAKHLHNAGIATIHQVGKKIVVYDKEAKAY